MKRIVNSIILTAVVYMLRNKQSSEVLYVTRVDGWGQANPSSVAFLIPFHDDGGTGAYKQTPIYYQICITEK